MKVYQGEVVRGPDGEPVEAEWPPVVSVDVWKAAQTKLNDPDRRIKFGQTYPSELLLSGVAVCSECGA